MSQIIMYSTSLIFSGLFLHALISRLSTFIKFPGSSRHDTLYSTTLYTTYVPSRHSQTEQNSSHPDSGSSPGQQSPPS